MDLVLNRKWPTAIAPNKPNKITMIYVPYGLKDGSDVIIHSMTNVLPTSITLKTKRMPPLTLATMNSMKLAMLVKMICLTSLWSWLMLKGLVISMREII